MSECNALWSWSWKSFFQYEESCDTIAYSYVCSYEREPTKIVCSCSPSHYLAQIITSFYASFRVFVISCEMIFFHKFSYVYCESLSFTLLHSLLFLYFIYAVFFFAHNFLYLCLITSCIYYLNC